MAYQRFDTDVLLNPGNVLLLKGILTFYKMRLCDHVLLSLCIHMDMRNAQEVVR